MRLACCFCCFWWTWGCGWKFWWLLWQCWCLHAWQFFLKVQDCTCIINFACNESKRLMHTDTKINFLSKKSILKSHFFFAKYRHFRVFEASEFKFTNRWILSICTKNDVLEQCDQFTWFRFFFFIINQRLRKIKSSPIGYALF